MKISLNIKQYSDKLQQMSFPPPIQSFEGRLQRESSPFYQRLDPRLKNSGMTGSCNPILRLLIIYSLSLILCIFISTLFVSHLNASAKTPKQAAGFESSPAWAKLDLRFRNEWKHLIKDDGGKKLACFIKTSRNLSDGDLAILKSSGFDYQAVAGKILTGKVRADKVPDVAGLDFIEAMELAVPVTPKE